MKKTNPAKPKKTDNRIRYDFCQAHIRQVSLDYRNTVPGFYAEGKHDLHDPTPLSVIFISGHKKDAINWVYNYRTEGIVGEKFTHKLLISQSDCRDVYHLEEFQLKLMLNRYEEPPGYSKWLIIVKS